MTPTSIALNRFGLGYRRDDPLPGDARDWLKRQIKVFNPTPSVLAGRVIGGPGFRKIVENSFAYRKQRKLESSAEERRRTAQSRTREVRNQLIGDIALRAKLALESDTPFMERMVHFWSNHFAVSADKRFVPLFVGSYEFGAIRAHVGGYFKDMLKSASLHPAMLAYLDQFQSQGPDSRAEKARDKRGATSRGLNENLGREIFELHTLGVGGGYSQEDIKELARALTGWTLQGIPYMTQARAQENGAAFFGWIHQPGSRTVLGRTYPDEGAGQAHAILDDLAEHPATARFIATKLARHFAGDVPPQSLVDRLARTFAQSGGHLPTVYEALIDAPEPWVEQPVKFRQPWEWAVGMLRASGELALADRQFAQMMRAVGQEVWLPRSPAGWDDREGSWAGSNALLRRIEAAERFAAETRLDDARELAGAMFPGALSETTAQTIRGAESNEMGFALLLVSPEMMRR